MLRKGLLCVLVILSASFLWWACNYVVEEKYVLPDAYKGFFSVLYQNDRIKPRLTQGSYRLYPISKDGVYESGYRFAKGSIKQTFYYEHGKQIKDIGFNFLGRMNLEVNNDKLIEIRDNPNEPFAILCYLTSVDANRNTLSIYIVLDGSKLFHLISNSEFIFKYIDGHKFDWQEDKETMLKNIARLNKELVEKNPPFD